MISRQSINKCLCLNNSMRLSVVALGNFASAMCSLWFGLLAYQTSWIFGEMSEDIVMVNVGSSVVLSLSPSACLYIITMMMIMMMMTVDDDDDDGDDDDEVMTTMI